MRKKVILTGYANVNWKELMDEQISLGGTNSYELPMVSQQQYYQSDKKVMIIIEEIPEEKE